MVIYLDLAVDPCCLGGLGDVQPTFDEPSISELCDNSNES